MNNKDVVEGNTAIMVFDGWVLRTGHTLDPENNRQNPGSNEYQYYDKDGHRVRPEDIEFDIVYHKSWNALMPVVEKIEQGDIGFKMCRKVVEVYVDSTKDVLFKVKESSRIESLYKAVVQFINHHNQNMKI